jgi:hypothetical protein
MSRKVGDDVATALVAGAKETSASILRLRNYADERRSVSTMAV